jgi:hypothetical protein
MFPAFGLLSGLWAISVRLSSLTLSRFISDESCLFKGVLAMVQL